MRQEVVFICFLFLVTRCADSQWISKPAASIEPCSSHYDKSSNNPWPNGIVPYFINNFLSENLQALIIDQINEIEHILCISFVPYTDQRDFVHFEPGKKTCSLYGKIGIGMHRVSLSANATRAQVAVVFVKTLGIANINELVKGDSIHRNVQSPGIQQTNKPALQALISNNNGEANFCKGTCKHNFTMNGGSSDAHQTHTLQSPGFPSPYKANLDCVWTVYNEKRTSLKISVEEIDIEDNLSCIYDYLEIVMLDGAVIRSVNRLCGTKARNSILTNSSKIIIRFHSDESYQYKGFNATISRMKYDCAVDNGGCEQHCMATGSGRVCKCSKGYQLSTNGKSCNDIDECKSNHKSGCQQVCVNSPGTYHCACHIGHSLTSNNISCKECGGTYLDQKLVAIDSPSFPLLYSPHHNCLWIIKTTRPTYYYVKVQNFHLKFSKNCREDFLKITDDSKRLKFSNHGRLCGHHTDISFVVRTAELQLQFKTQSSGGTGFKLIYLQTNPSGEYIQIDGKRTMI